MIKPNWFPPLSPHSLIQEHLFPNEWLILVSCVLLNCTSRKQVQKVIPFFEQHLSTPQDFLNYDENTIKQRLKSLGFVHRRYDRLKSLAEYIIQNPHWKNPLDLPGIGQYGADAWNIFCNDVMSDVPPQDGSLTLYWEWRQHNEKQRKRQETTSQELEQIDKGEPQ